MRRAYLQERGHSAWRQWSLAGKPREFDVGEDGLADLETFYAELNREIDQLQDERNDIGACIRAAEAFEKDHPHD